MRALTAHRRSPSAGTSFAARFDRQVAAAGCAAAVAIFVSMSGASAQEVGIGAGSGGPRDVARPTGAPRSPGVADRGARLFSGQARFAKGGPPCGACHSAAGLPFPGGGTMGPDLTDAYSKYGPEPLETVLTTLFFPTMNPVFAGRPLTAAERGDLVAFLSASAKEPPPAGTTLRMLLFGLLVFVGLAIVIALLGRSRLRGVRAPLVRAATRRMREARP